MLLRLISVKLLGSWEHPGLGDPSVHPCSRSLWAGPCLVFPHELWCYQLPAPAPKPALLSPPGLSASSSLPCPSCPCLQAAQPADPLAKGSGRPVGARPHHAVQQAESIAGEQTALWGEWRFYFCDWDRLLFSCQFWPQISTSRGDSCVMLFLVVVDLGFALGVLCKQCVLAGISVTVTFDISKVAPEVSDEDHLLKTWSWRIHSAPLDKKPKIKSMVRNTNFYTCVFWSNVPFWK